MDPISAVSSSLSQARIGGQISMAVASKVLDSAREQGAAIVGMIQAAAQVAAPERYPNQNASVVDVYA